MHFCLYVFLQGILLIHGFRNPQKTSYLFSTHDCKNCNSQNSMPSDKSILRSWTCIGVQEHIDWSKPYRVQLGDLPLVIWSDGQSQSTTKLKHPAEPNSFFSTINICPHMGSKLDNGIITPQGKLQCQYHGKEFDKKDQFGQVKLHEGKLFWALNPIHSSPPPIPYFHHPNYVHSFLELDMDAGLKDCALNSMDLRHPEYVHRMGFGSPIPATNIKNYLYPSRKGYADRVGLSFDYQSNPIMQQINQNFEPTHNFHMFVYPTFSWSRVSFQDKHLIVALNLLPLSPNKTRWYVTLIHNYSKTKVQKQVMKLLALTIMKQDFVQMRMQQPESALKTARMFEQCFDDESVILRLYNMLEDYEYPSIGTIGTYGSSKTSLK
uniref:Rieske domain-containing protein n=1 Tax=viral metagenome TaxID=1070528 RepID=A0A6C0HVL7_9ZZZZ